MDMPVLHGTVFLLSLPQVRLDDKSESILTICGVGPPKH